MRKVREILRLRWGERRSLRQTAASCGIACSTVYEVGARAKAAGLRWPLPEGLDDAELEHQLFPPAEPSRARPRPDFEHIHRELKRRGVTLELLWQEYRERVGDEGYGYSRYCDFYREWRGTIDPVMRQEHRAGEKLFVDWAGMKMELVDRETGDITKCSVFVAALGASSFTYAEATESEDLDAWVACHVHAYDFLGGVPAVTVPDNLKTGVVRPCLYEPDLNPTYREMADHYGTTIIPARVRRPKDKAKVENAVLQVERWVLAPLRDQKFFSLAELNRAMRSRLAWLNDRPFSRLEGPRRSLWEALDRPALKPLPARRFEISESRPSVGVNIDYHFEFNHHYYSVPYQLVGRRLYVRATATVVEAFHQGRRVASHRRSDQRGRYTTDPTHRPDSHRRYADWSPSRMIRWAEKTGPHTAGLVRQVLASRPHPEQGYRSCLGIIRLGKRYGHERLERACERALRIGSASYRSIQSIIKN